jgi:hypothetical protein
MAARSSSSRYTIEIALFMESIISAQPKEMALGCFLCHGNYIASAVFKVDLCHHRQLGNGNLQDTYTLTPVLGLK